MRTDKDSKGFPSREEVDYFWLYRNRMNMEDDLTNHRMTWLILTQTLLIALWVGAYTKGILKEVRGLGVLAFVVGIGSAALIFAGVWAAQHEISRLNHEYWHEYPSGSPHPRLPLLVGDALGHGLGKFAPYGVPVLFAAVWICLVLCSLQ